MAGFSENGFEIHRALFAAGEIGPLREEADRLAREAGSACVRHVREKSAHLAALATDARLTGLLPDGFVPVRSLLFDKTAAENWPVAWHQDLTIAVKAEIAVSGYGPWSRKDGVPHVQPPIRLLEQMRTVRLHLDETDADNGALRVIPGSHRLGRLPTAAVADNLRDETACVCSPGDVLVMAPLILHASRRSTAPLRRRVIHLEFAPPDALDTSLKWFEAP